MDKKLVCCKRCGRIPQILKIDSGFNPAGEFEEFYSINHVCPTQYYADESRESVIDLWNENNSVTIKRTK